MCFRSLRSNDIICLSFSNCKYFDFSSSTTLSCYFYEISIFYVDPFLLFSLFRPAECYLKINNQESWGLTNLCDFIGKLLGIIDRGSV